MKKKLLSVVLGVFAFFTFNGIVSAEEVSITPDMSQEEIDSVVAATNAQDVITITSGDYSTVKNGKNYHKTITVEKDNSQFVISGSYTELQFIVRANSVKITANNAEINGNASTKGNPCAAIFVEQGNVTLYGDLTLTNHNNSVRIGYKNATTNVSSKFTLSENAKLTVQNNVFTYSSNYYGTGYDDPDSPVYASAVSKDQVNGTSGSGIDVRGNGYASFIMEKNSKFYALGNANAGIFVINVANFTYDMAQYSYALFQKNAQGICMNTDYAHSVNINMNSATMDLLDNTSNGITGQNLPYVLHLKNSKLTAKNNAIGINNFYIISENSTMSVTNNRSHGISNVSLDATGSNIDVSDNAYIGINITKYNAGKESTDIIGTTITANNNGGPGVRFYVTNGVTNITNSNITTNGDGSADSVYGFEVKPNDSAYWAGVVAKGTLYAKNSTMMSDGVSGYALYDTSSGKANFYVLENTVAAEKGTESSDIFDDYNSSKGNSGSTIVTGGSLQIDIDNVSMSDTLKDKYNSEQNPTMPNESGAKENVQYAAPVNNDGTALTQFILHKNINKVVGGNGSHTFTYYDPNFGTKYNYTFRYNELGEDLNPVISGRSYVWTPVSILHYDATEGYISDLGTAGIVRYGSSITTPFGLNTRYTNDVTIFGNSLNLAEKLIAAAAREGYVFLGWYIASDNELAKEYAANGEFEKLYSLLNVKFDENTNIEINGVPAAELTVYAKWALPEETKIEVMPPKTGVNANNAYPFILILLSLAAICNTVIYKKANN